MNSAKLKPDDIYEKLRKNVYTEDLMRKINHVWRLNPEKGRLRIPINQLVVNGVDTSKYDDFEEKLEAQKATNGHHTNHHMNEGGNIEMVHMGSGRKKKGSNGMDINEGNAKAMIFARNCGIIQEYVKSLKIIRTHRNHAEYR